MKTANYMLSGLERELELYMGEDQESPAPETTYKWKDDTGADRISTLRINETTGEGAIVIPQHLEKDNKTVPQKTHTFKNVQKTSDGMRIYGNPTGFPGKETYTVRIMILSSASDSKLLVHTRAPKIPIVNPSPQWEDYAQMKIDQKTAEDLKRWVTERTVAVRSADLEMTSDYSYESSSPDSVFEKIRVKVDTISDASLTRKPVKNTPVELTLEFDLRRKRLTISARQLDIQYVYDVNDVDDVRSDPTGAFVTGRMRRHRGSFLKLYLIEASAGSPGYLFYESYITETPTSHDEQRKKDRYVIESVDEEKKFKAMFSALLSNGQIEPPKPSRELELDDYEEDEEAGFDFEQDEDDELDDEGETEQELDDLEDDGVTEMFARRLREISGRSFESAYELEQELDDALETMENEFMVNRLRRRRKRGKRKGLFKKILSTGAKIVGAVAAKTPVGSLIKAGTSLVRGQVGKALGSLAKAAVGAALPPGVGSVATAAMDAIGGGGEAGGEEGEIRTRKARAARRFAHIARDAYREVADTLQENFDHPLVANEVAQKAVHKAMVKNGVRPPAKVAAAHPQRRVIKIKPGERVVIIRA
jgi:hypothetical protein